MVSLTLGVKGHWKRVRRTQIVMLTQQQQLQLSLRVPLVSPKLLLDLLVDPLVLSVLRRYATSSHGSNWAGLHWGLCGQPENFGSVCFLFWSCQPLLHLTNSEGGRRTASFSSPHEKISLLGKRKLWPSPTSDGFGWSEASGHLFNFIRMSREGVALAGSRRRLSGKLISAVSRVCCFHQRKYMPPKTNICVHWYHSYRVKSVFNVSHVLKGLQSVNHPPQFGSPAGDAPLPLSCLLTATRGQEGRLWVSVWNASSQALRMNCKLPGGKRLPRRRLGGHSSRSNVTEWSCKWGMSIMSI